MSPLRSWYILTSQRLKRFVKKLLGREVKPTWVVYGNCNAQAFTQFLHALTDVGERYEIVWGRSYNATEPLDLSQCERIWAQLDEGNPLIYPSHIPAISFPPCNSFLLWPVSTLDPLTSGEHNQFPYGDEIIIALSEDETVTEENVYARYIEKLDTMLGRIDASYEKDKALLESRDSKCDIKIGDFMLKNFRSKELQMSYNHPRTVTLLELFCRLCEASGLDVDEVRRRAWTKWPRTYQPFDGIQVPVMPQVAAHHGLEWWSADSLYPFHGEKISAETYLQKFLAFRRSKMAAQVAKSA